MAVSLQLLLRTMHEQGGSDLHVTALSPPQIRIDGKLTPLRVPALTPDETRRMCYSMINEKQRKKFESTNELDFSFGLKGLCRFRGNMFVQKGAVAAVFRTIPYDIKQFEQLGLPPVVAQIAERPRGLVLVTGPTGSGKTTTLAAIIDKINRERREHIITIEDPIEYIHEHKRCVVNQREIGADSFSFHDSLRAVLRQDPDVVLIGELRDLETMEAAMTLAETGHLCFATLHTNGAVQTINRVIDSFPMGQQAQIRTTFSLVLEGVLSQQLVPKIGGGRALALEVMVPNAAIRNLIREDKIHQVQSAMQTGQATTGMTTLNQALINLIRGGKINLKDAEIRCTDLDEFHRLCENNGITIQRIQHTVG